MDKEKLMQQWQQLLTKGNNYYHQKNWQQAESYYREAEEMLDNAWCNDTSNTDTLMAWICATHNLAALFEKQGEHIVSLQFLIMSHQRVLSLATADHLNSKIKMLAIKTLKVTLDPITLFRKKYPICNKCFAALLNGEKSNTHKNRTLH